MSGRSAPAVKVRFKEQRLVVNPSLTAVLELQWRQRGKELQNVRIKPRDNPRLADLVVRYFAAVGEPQKLARFVEENGDLLVEFGLLVPARDVPEVVPNDPVLDPKLLALVAPKHRARFARSRKARQRLAFDRDRVFIQHGDTRPDVPFPGMPPEGHFPRGKQLLWVFDEGTRMWSFFRLSRADMTALAALKKSGAAGAGLPPSLLETYAHARILVDEDHARERADLWAALDESTLRTREAGFAVARDVLPPLQLAHLRAYSRRLHDEGYFYCDEKHVRASKRDYLRLDPLIGFVHRQSGALVRRMTGAELFPSWQLLSRYRAGARLTRHLDRDQCDWNGSVALDSIIQGAAREPWPLCIVTPKGTTRISLDLGDLALYQGRHSPHFRPTLGARRIETIMLWFFVPVGFQGDTLE